MLCACWPCGQATLRQRGASRAGIYEPQFSYAEDAERDHLFDEALNANAGIVRIGVAWDDVAGSQPPADPRDPSDPSYDFANIDRAVLEAHARGLDVMFSSLVHRRGRWGRSAARCRDAASELGS